MCCIVVCVAQSLVRTNWSEWRALWVRDGSKSARLVLSELLLWLYAGCNRPMRPPELHHLPGLRRILVRSPSPCHERAPGGWTRPSWATALAWAKNGSGQPWQWRWHCRPATQPQPPASLYVQGRIDSVSRDVLTAYSRRKQGVRGCLTSLPFNPARMNPGTKE